MQDGTVRILFVDDESNVLQGLRRTLHKQRKQWPMAFANGGAAALAALERESFDIIVSDLQMPMDGITLLRQVRETYPHTIRIILSGQAEGKLLMQSAEVAHQFLAKPCDVDQLKNVLDRACRVKQFISEQELLALLGSLGNLPARPEIYTQLMEKLSLPETTIHEIGALVAEDIAISSKMLQLVNSAFFGLGHRVVAAEQAAALLGVDLIRGITLGMGTFQMFAAERASGLSEAALYNHSHETALMSREIAKTVSDPAVSQDDAFLAGMLHDIGHLILATHRPEEFRQAYDLAVEDSCPLHSKEKPIFGTTHAQIGAYLLGLWGLPLNVVEAIAFHHEWDTVPNPQFNLAFCIHMANAVLGMTEQQHSATRQFLNDVSESQAGWAEQWGASEHLQTWKTYAMQLRGDQASDTASVDHGRG